MPEQGKGIEYEFDLLLELSPDHVANVIKDRTGKYQDAMIEKPDEAFGRALAEWLEEGQPAPASPTTPAAEASDQKPVKPDLSRLKDLIAEHGLTEEQQARWCSHFKVERIDQLSQEQVDAIVAKIGRTIAEKGA